MNGILWNREIPKQCKTTIREVRFKHVLTQDTLTKRNNSKIQAMDIVFLRSEGKTRRVRTRNEMSREV
jgi:hypothetical protein